MVVIKELEYANNEQLAKWLNSLRGRIIAVNTQTFGSGFKADVVLEEPKIVARVTCSAASLLEQIQRLYNTNQTVLAIESTMGGYNIVTLR